jgi:hypothetical protein
LTETVTGGSWSSSLAATATVTSTGLVAGVSLGSAVISYSSANTCGTAIDTFGIFVLPTPNAGTISGADSICINDSVVLSVSVAGGSWSSSAAAIASTDASLSGRVIGISNGTATISYTVNNGCGIASATHNVYVKTPAECALGVLPVFVATQQGISVYPNPANGVVQVTISSKYTSLEASVLDLSGKVLSVVPVSGNSQQFTVDLSQFAAGTYLLNTKVDGITYQTKVVIW